MTCAPPEHPPDCDRSRRLPHRVWR